MVNSQQSTIVPSFLGGVIVCLATSLNLYLKGRLANDPSLVNGIIKLEKPRIAWRLSTIAGIIFSGAVAFHLYGFGYLGEVYLFDLPLTFISGLDYAGWILGALFVGFGGRLANGDLSAHIYCGIPRLARRQIVASLVFLAVTFVVASLRFRYPFFYDTVWAGTTSTADVLTSSNIAIGLCVIVVVFCLISNENGAEGNMDVIISFLVGFLYGAGLIVGGICKRNKVLGFFTLGDQWDPSLAFFLGAIVLGNWLTFNCIFARGQPTQGSRFEVPNSEVIDLKLIIGCVVFGLGWGITGLSIGPALVVSPLYLPQIIALFIPGICFGSLIADKTIESWDNRGFDSFDQ